jgi:dihydroorotase
MKVLIKKAYIADPLSSHYQSAKDILINNGIIQSIADNISERTDHTIEETNLHISTGWIDIFAHFCDPGYEHKETLQTGALAALLLMQNRRLNTLYSNQNRYPFK